MIRVLYCTDFLMSGGVERQITELVTRLDRTRFEPHLICLYGPNAGRSLHFLPRIEAANVPVHLLDLGWSAKDKLRGWQALAGLTWQLRPHIFHAVNYHSNLLSRLARPLMHPRLKLIGAVRATYTAKQLRYEHLSWRLCSTIVCNSPHLQRQLVEQAKVPASRVLMIPNGVDTGRFEHNPQPELREKIASGATLVLTMVGRLAYPKAPHLLAQAIGQLREQGKLSSRLKVILVGEQEDEAIQATLDEAIQRYQLHDIFQQYHQTDCPEAYYHATDVTILVSLAEGMPNVALESLATGRPVIIFDGANAAGVIRHNETGWVVNTGDVDHLAGTLYHVMNLPRSTLTAMRQNCLVRAADFSMERMVNNYEQLYQRLITIPIP
ncbi:MAG: hypothetical protein DPW16_04895 [Chloroflexi bacterium]|nr:hypothetical protein [Chloroflexota bacterium]